MNFKLRRYLKFLIACFLLVISLCGVRKSGILCPSQYSDDLEIERLPSRHLDLESTFTLKPTIRKGASELGDGKSPLDGLQTWVKVQNMLLMEKKVLEGSRTGLADKQIVQPQTLVQYNNLHLEEGKEKGLNKPIGRAKDDTDPVMKDFKPKANSYPKMQQDRSHLTTSSLVESTTAELKYQLEQNRNNERIPSTIATDTQVNKPLNCVTLPCLNYLAREDLLQFDSCDKIESKFPLVDSDRPWATNCHFRSGYTTKQYRHVALLSSPGAEIDHFRRIFEIVTGFCTGSVKCDRELKNKGMVGENVASTTVLLVKMDAQLEDEVTMLSSQNGGGMNYSAYDSVIFLYRNPYKSIMDEWIKIDNSNLENSTVKWNEFVVNQTEVWEQSIKNGVFRPSQMPVHLVKYENILNDMESQIKEVLTFLELSPTLTIPVGLTWSKEEYKARRTAVKFNYQQRKLVNSAIQRMAKELSSKHRFSDSVEMVSYISTGI